MLHKPISKMWLLYVCLLACLSGCKQCTEPPAPTKLPDATQTGANTFGCMLNGNLWVAQGSGSGFNPATRPNPYLYYDATFKGGSLDVSGDIIIDDNTQSIIAITGSNIGAVGEYTQKNSNILFVYNNFLDLKEPTFRTNEGISSYNLVITKLDIQNKIIAGTFSFSVEKGGYKAVVTDGRFDIKYL